MAVKAVIFDMDGVLIDSEPLWKVAMREVFRQVGFDFDSVDHNETQGLKIEHVVDYWFARSGITGVDQQKIVEQIIDRVEELVLEKGQILPGIDHMFNIAKKLHLKVGVATSSTRRLADSFLKKAGIATRLDVLRTGDGEKHAKPHPSIYIHCAEDLGLKPYECMVIEDSVNGTLSAKAAGMFCISIPDHEHWADKRYGIADIKLHSMEEITEEMVVSMQ